MSRLDELAEMYRELKRVLAEADADVEETEHRLLNLKRYRDRVAHHVDVKLDELLAEAAGDKQ